MQEWIWLHITRQTYNWGDSLYNRDTWRRGYWHQNTLLDAQCLIADHAWQRTVSTSISSSLVQWWPQEVCMQNICVGLIIVMSRPYKYHWTAWVVQCCTLINTRPRLGLIGPMDHHDSHNKGRSGGIWLYCSENNATDRSKSWVSFLLWSAKMVDVGNTFSSYSS